MPNKREIAPVATSKSPLISMISLVFRTLAFTMTVSWPYHQQQYGKREIGDPIKIHLMVMRCTEDYEDQPNVLLEN